MIKVLRDCVTIPILLLILSAPASAAVQINCATLPSANAPQSNVRGAVGPSRIVVLTTTEIGIYNKVTCQQLVRKTLRTFFTELITSMPSGLTIREAKILYDRGAQRFFIMAFATQAGFPNLYYLFAGSDSNRGDTWQGSVGELPLAPQTNQYVFTGFGFNSVWLAATFDETPIVGGSTSTVIIANQKYMGLGGSFYPSFVDRVSVGQLQPSISLDSDGAFYFLSVGRQSGNGLTRVRWIYDYPRRNITADTISIEPWTVPPDAVQPNGQKIDTGDGRFTTPGVRMGDSLWQVHTVNVGGQARWRLYKLSTTSPTPLLTFTPNTVAGVHHSFNASVATALTTAGAPVFVGFSRTRPSLSSGRVASLMALGPNNATTGWVTRTIALSNSSYSTAANGLACNNTSLGACRWSATSSTVIDPANVGAAWSVNQLSNGTTERQWTTISAKAN